MAGVAGVFSESMRLYITRFFSLPLLYIRREKSCSIRRQAFFIITRTTRLITSILLYLLKYK